MLTNAEVRKTLKGSIAKWTDIANGKGIDDGIMNNPLCHMFYGSYKTRCHGCPVKEFTGAAYCSNTPYVEWHNNRSTAGHKMNMAATAKDRKLARAERDFLVRLDKHYFENIASPNCN